MKQFFKFMFASMLGFFLTFIIIFFIMVGMIASIASFSRKDVVEVEKQSVLHLSLDKEIVDRGGRSPFESFDFFSFSPSSAIGLNDIINNLKKAKKDDKIEGIFLDLSLLSAGWSTIHEIRQAIEDFKESGKFVVAYGESFTQNAYYLATTADEIYLHPEGVVDFRGINAEMFFLKNMLDRLGIDPQIIRHGEFKSAGEMFNQERMSPENREQMTSYINSIWNNVMADIAKSRGLSVNHLNQVANELLTRNSELAMEWDMIDGIMHRDQILDEIRTRIGIEPEDDINFISLARYDRAPRPKAMERPRTRDKIAVVYGMGNILPGSGSETTIGSDRIAGAIREARKDTTVKAIVFRINSPGGSALASDVILREVKLAAQEKPVIASMGDVAASGGYYIACKADLIVANPNTITGSIGVFGMIPNMQGFFNEKLGITFDNVKTNDFSDLASVSRPLTRAEREIIKEGIERVYETFISHVAEGREMTTSTVDELGRGRVWSGSEARQNGLIDEFGGLNYAIEKAAEMAELENYRLVEYPKRREFLAMLMEDFGGIRENRLKNKLGSAYHLYKQVDQVNEMTGILMRMPYDPVLD